MRIDAKGFLEENANNKKVFVDVETMLNEFAIWREQKKSNFWELSASEMCHYFNERFKVGEKILYRKTVDGPYEEEIIKKAAFILNGMPVIKLDESEKHWLVRPNFLIY
jgi:hypothetical protein